MDPILYKKSINTSPQLDFESLKKDLFTLFRSPNPVAIYMKSKEIKEKFSLFLNELSTKVSAGFDLQEDAKSFIYGVYKMSGYEKVWIYNLENYLRESKNFDLLFYFYAGFLLNPQQKTLALALLKKKKGYTDEEILLFLQSSGSDYSLKHINDFYTAYSLQDITLSINLREDFVEHFIEKVYLSLGKNISNQFLDHFILKIDKKNLDFQAVVKILQKIIANYATNGKAKNMYKTVEMPYFQERKKIIDDFLDHFHSIRGDFYQSICTTLEDLPLSERSVFWLYVKTQMIDRYFSEIKLLFYEFSSNAFLDKDTFSNLKGNVKLPEIISEKAQFIYQDYKELVDLKNLIVELQNNLFSFFLLPLIYYTISEKITFPKKDLYKLKYVLLFIFSSNYSEYKKIYMFFNQLEIFLNYEQESNVFGKLQVSFSLIILLSIGLIFSYYYLPIGVFIGILMLSCIKGYEIIYPNIYYNIKWNSGLKFFSILFLCVSTYFWFQNFEQIKKDSNEIVQKIEFLGKLPTSSTIESGIQYLKTSLFDVK